MEITFNQTGLSLRVVPSKVRVQQQHHIDLLGRLKQDVFGHGYKVGISSDFGWNQAIF
jgi:hypothetical protein